MSITHIDNLLIVYYQESCVLIMKHNRVITVAM